MTKGLCKNVKVLTQPYFFAKKQLFIGEERKNGLENAY